MSTVPSERKSWGPLIATIDLLFLVVAFFTLLLFFVQKEREQAKVQVNKMQETLAAALPEANRTPEEKGNAMVTLVERLMAIQKDEQDRQEQAQKREERRRMRPIERVNYQVLPGGTIVYDGRRFSADEFKSQVIDTARKSHWLAIRAYAPPETPFGEVVAMRKLLLDNGGEFDTYWDNLSESATSPGADRPAKPRSP